MEEDGAEVMRAQIGRRDEGSQRQKLEA